ncbi:DNA-binding response regulator [Sinomonas cellulolyticus]|uniref:Response regulator transcription factor n=1 Tax=Sinomonas cellulolyticus TaxID=2801916 RepID=A0ABS1K0U7_9MICC|nr:MULTISPECIES: response regulator transcription factor [Sinomonas]MBL0704502.1 response regulator transcription factor [Sinomonas cellulolyticus]GHG49048.1 DNA-binding response regulator [Sinomonas sp. KCTC 49339]
MIRVLVVDDQALLRAGFRALLDAEPDMEVVGEAGTGADAVAAAARLAPDVVLMDIRMPGGDGLEATQAILSAHPEGLKVIILTTFELDEYITGAIRAGASGFLVKDTDPADLVRAVRAVHDGDAMLSPSVTRRLLARLAAEQPPAGAAEPAADVGQLTEREREVVSLVGQGLNNAEIGATLFITPLTAKTHVSRAMTKLGLRDRAQLVVLAYESGLVRPGWLG